MGIIDERGRLFGLVNVIDALVVLLVLAVLVAGTAFVLQSESGPDESTESTESTEPPMATVSVEAILDLGSLPELAAHRISAGDSFHAGGNSTLTITDVYVTPRDGNVRVLLVVEVSGPALNETVSYGGDPLYPGSQLTLRTPEYQVAGSILTVDDRFDVTTTGVLVNQTTSVSTASAIEAGDRYVLAGHEVATVESVDAFATKKPDKRRVFLGLSLRTIDLGYGPLFGFSTLRRGDDLLFRADGYHFVGSIERVGTTELSGEPSTREVVLELDAVEPAVANGLRAGLTETIAGRTNARITAVETEPAPVLVTTDDGRLVVSDHPTQKRVTLTAVLATRDTTTGPTFKGEHLQLGRTFVLDLDVVTIEPTVVDIRNSSTSVR